MVGNLPTRSNDGRTLNKPVAVPRHLKEVGEYGR
jgi:hypothetical protein